MRWCGRARALVATAGALFAVVPSCVANRCRIIDARIVNYAAANCEGDAASSCWTITSVQLPREMSSGNVTVRSTSLRAWRSLVELHSHGLTVVHSGGGYGNAGKEGLHGVRGQGGDREVGLHFSVDTRIVELPEGPSVLQVQVLYGDARDDMSRDTPGWHSLQPAAVHPGGRHLKLDVIFCVADGSWEPYQQAGHAAHGVGRRGKDSMGARARKGIRRASFQDASASLQPKTMPGVTGTGDGSHVISRDPAGVSTEGRSAPAIVGGMVEPHEFVAKVDSPKQVLSWHMRNKQAHRQDYNLWGEQAGACDPFHGGDQWCRSSLTKAQFKALQESSTSLYCSRECASGDGLWCDIFGNKNCRMCSHDCDAFCEGEEDCSCHRCPDSSASEASTCTVGDPMACYDQMTETDLLNLAKSKQLVTCDASCLIQPDGPWCNAMGIQGCQLCSQNCDDYCERQLQLQEGEQCQCVQCSSGVSAPHALGRQRSLPSCMHSYDGDALCYSQFPEQARKDLSERRMGVECHHSCYPGRPWSLSCFAQEMIGCRYCCESCEHLCGEGVAECDSCNRCTA